MAKGQGGLSAHQPVFGLHASATGPPSDSLRQSRGLPVAQGPRLSQKVLWRSGVGPGPPPSPTRLTGSFVPLQKDFTVREELQQQDVERWLGFITFLCEVFGAMRSSTGEPFRVLVCPIYTCLREVSRCPALTTRLSCSRVPGTRQGPNHVKWSITRLRETELPRCFCLL